MLAFGFDDHALLKRVALVLAAAAVSSAAELLASGVVLLAFEPNWVDCFVVLPSASFVAVDTWPVVALVASFVGEIGTFDLVPVAEAASCFVLPCFAEAVASSSEVVGMPAAPFEEADFASSSCSCFDLVAESFDCLPIREISDVEPAHPGWFQSIPSEHKREGACYRGV